MKQTNVGGGVCNFEVITFDYIYPYFFKKWQQNVLNEVWFQHSRSSVSLTPDDYRGHMNLYFPLSANI